MCMYDRYVNARWAGLHVYLCVSKYVCIYVGFFPYICLYTHTHIHIHIRIRIQKNPMHTCRAAEELYHRALETDPRDLPTLCNLGQLLHICGNTRYLYIYVCMYLCICTYVCVCIYVSIVCVYVCIYVDGTTCMHPQKCAIYICQYTQHIHTHAHAQGCHTSIWQSFRNRQIYIHIYIHTYIHTCTGLPHKYSTKL